MAARLGELLVRLGLLTTDQLERALRAQVMWGGRLGTNLIELGCVDLDTLARVLGEQHNLLPALGKQFERVDRELQLLLSPDVAEKYSCVPLMRVGSDRKIVIASIGPLAPRAIAIVADELAVDPTMIVCAVAAELRIRYHLERVYQIPRDTRFLRSRGKSVPPFPTFPLPASLDSEPDVALPSPTEPAPLDMQLGHLEDRLPIPVPRPQLELDPEPEPEPEPEPAPPWIAPPRMPEPVAIPTLASDDLVDDGDDIDVTIDDDEPAIEAAADVEASEAAGRDRRRYVPTLADTPKAAALDPEVSNLGRVAIRRVAVANQPAEVVQPFACATLGEATRAIRRATGRDRVAVLVMETIERFAPTCDAALFLVLRNEVAIGWSGFARSGAALPQVAVPLEQPGIVPTVVRQNTTARRNGADLGELDARLLGSLDCADDRGNHDLVVVPITIGGQVMCMIAISTAADASVSVVEAAAAAAAAAFARLMRDASR